MRAVLLIVLGVFVGYQLGKAAQRRSETSFEEGSADSTASGRGKKLAGLAAAASMAAVHRVRSNAASH